MKRSKRKSLSKDQQQNVAEYIVKNQDKPLKQVAYDLSIPYSIVARILRERVNISKVLSLRYPDTPEQK